MIFIFNILSKKCHKKSVKICLMNELSSYQFLKYINFINMFSREKNRTKRFRHIRLNDSIPLFLLVFLHVWWVFVCLYAQNTVNRGIHIIWSVSTGQNYFVQIYGNSMRRNQSLLYIVFNYCLVGILILLSFVTVSL